ncbi:MAG: hypothetical protein QGF29_01460, partial [Verrucomicrobiota bacterium]|nr:hypothetical protein [Verrucomicrobiota bacterium]
PAAWELPGDPRSPHGHGKDSMRFEHVGQRPPVAGLKDVQGKDHTGKQRGVAQNHQRVLPGISTGKICTKVEKTEEITHIKGCLNGEVAPLFPNYERQ